MPLVDCPDCGREISASAPACPHCGRPMAPAPAAAASSHPKPVAGIAAVLVICGIGVVRAVLPSASSTTNPELEGFAGFVHATGMLGDTAAIIGALMALMGNRAGNRVVRVASLAMIPVALMVVALASKLMQRVPGAEEAHTALVLLTLAFAAAGLAPWLLFLFLFRRKKYG